MLQASEVAAYCLPDVSLAPDNDTRELDHLVAMAFGWWDGLLGEKTPFDLEGWTPPD